MFMDELEQEDQNIQRGRAISRSMKRLRDPQAYNPERLARIQKTMVADVSKSELFKRGELSDLRAPRKRK